MKAVFAFLSVVFPIQWNLDITNPYITKVLGITDHTLRPSAVKPFNTNTDGAGESVPINGVSL